MMIRTRTRIPLLQAILTGLACILLSLSAQIATADCSVIAPEGFDHRSVLGSTTSPFLTPGLTNDLKLVGAICDQAERSSAADFTLDGVELSAEDFVVTIAFISSSAPPLLLLGADPSLCGTDANCTVDPASNVEIVELPLPGGGAERRLRFRVPEDLTHFGPARLAVKLANDPQPVASELRSVSCSDATGDLVACVDEFYALDGSCRTGAEFLDQPFAGLVAIPKTDFTEICTSGCDEFPNAGISSTLPITIDRNGNIVFSMIYADQLVRASRGDELVDPNPRSLAIRMADAANNGFTDAVYEGKPSSFTFEGFPLSPPFNPFVDPTAATDEVGIWGMADAEATVHFVPRRSCSDDPARACTGDADCGDGLTCNSNVEFDFAEDVAAIELPVAGAEARQAFQLNSWLDGSLDDLAVAVVEDERLSGAPVNSDGAADDLVGELLDRGTGLLKRLGGLFPGRGITQLRIVEGEEDYLVPSVAAEDKIMVFLESEFAEGLANPLTATTGAEALAADANGNNRLDQNLRVYSLGDDPAAEEAQNLLPEGLNIAVLGDGRFDDRKNLVLSEGKVFFAYSPAQQEPHAYQLVNQSSTGEPANSTAGNVDVSSRGDFIAFTSTATNLYIPEAAGALVATTSGGVVLRAVTGADGEFPVIADGQTVFEYVATDDGKGPAPSQAYLELPLCDTGAGEPDLVALVDLIETGPNASIELTPPQTCPDCAFTDGAVTLEFNRGLGKGGSQTYRLVFSSPDVPSGEVGVNFKNGGRIENTAIRGPACLDPTLVPDIDRVYLRDVDQNTTTLVSVRDRSSCGETTVPTNEPSGNPDVTQSGDLVFFDSVAGLTDDDADGVADIYVYDPATCDLINLSGSSSDPATNPTSSDDGMIVAFESGEAGTEPTLMLLDRVNETLVDLGPGGSPSLSADGSKLVYTANVSGFSQVFLVEIDAGVAGPPIAVSILDGGFFDLGAGAPSVANSGKTAFETPPGDVDSEIFVRDVDEAVTIAASTLPTLESICTTSPCGAFSVSISDDGQFVAYVVRGLDALDPEFDEILLKHLPTGSITPLTRMAGADASSFEPSLGASGDFVALTSFASQLGGVMGAGSPNVFLEGPADPSVSDEAFLGFLDLAACGDNGPCAPVLTTQPVSRGASFDGDLAVVGSPVRVVQSGGGGGLSVRAFGREGSDVALSSSWVCAIADTNDSGQTGQFAACGDRGGSSLSDLTVGGAALEAAEIGLCGDRAIVLGTDGVLYEADLASGAEADPIQAAEDFELGEGLDTDGDGNIDSCLVAYRTLETDLGGSASQVGNRDLDTDDLAMFVLGADGVVTDCVSSTSDCPGQACPQFNYQVGEEAVVFLVDEFEENFGFGPAEDICSPGTDINEDGFCDVSVRRCTAAGSVTEGTSFGRAGNVFAEGRFPDGENTVTEAGFCGSDPLNVRLGQLCTDDLDCLAEPGETCQLGVVVLSALADTDGDEIPDVYDNCPKVPNPDQANSDLDDPLLVPDAQGDACDVFTCNDGNVQEAEVCDDGPLNGTPGSSCSATCECGVQFEVTETLKPGSNGNTPIVIFGSAAADGSGCLNLDTRTVAGLPAKGIDATTLRLSATMPTVDCPSTGGAPAHDLSRRYNSHVRDSNEDGIQDLLVHVDTPPIGGDQSTEFVYLTGRFSESNGGGCFLSTAPVRVSGN